jgi:putative transcriptional regulator
MTIHHHPDISTLMSCAAGSQPEALAAVVASHLAICPACAKEVSKMERIGEALFDHIEPAHVEGLAPVAAARALEADDLISLGGVAAGGEVPLPLAGLVGSDLNAIAWKRLGPGLWHYPLPLSKSAKGDLRLLKVGPGQVMPDHGHGGEEMTLVLRGSYSDATGRYGAGDVADLADDMEHAPLADSEDGCICLIASEKPARFKGLIARMMQPLAGM